MPCILVVYDAGNDIAYWVYVQAYFESVPGFSLKRAGKTVTIHLPKANKVDEAAMRRFARYRDDVMKQIKGVVHDNANHANST